MMRRIFNPTGATILFVLLSGLVLSGLTWVTVASVQVESAQREARLTADRATKERLALWRMDGFVLPAYGVETNRPFAHYSALHTAYPTVEGDLDFLNNELVKSGNLRLPSPLLSVDLPPWMALHFQLDPDTGWESPQVIPAELLERLSNGPPWLVCQNVTPQRQLLLNRLAHLFNHETIFKLLAEADRLTSEEDLFLLPALMPAEPSTPKPSDGAPEAERKLVSPPPLDSFRRGHLRSTQKEPASENPDSRAGYARQLIPNVFKVPERLDQLQNFPVAPPGEPVVDGGPLPSGFGGIGGLGHSPGLMPGGLGGANGPQFAQGTGFQTSQALLPRTSNPSNSGSLNQAPKGDPAYDKRDEVAKAISRSNFENLPSSRGVMPGLEKQAASNSARGAVPPALDNAPPAAAATPIHPAAKASSGGTLAASTSDAKPPPSSGAVPLPAGSPPNPQSSLPALPTPTTQGVPVKPEAALKKQDGEQKKPVEMEQNRTSGSARNDRSATTQPEIQPTPQERTDQLAMRKTLNDSDSSNLDGRDPTNRQKESVREPARSAALTGPTGSPRQPSQTSFAGERKGSPGNQPMAVHVGPLRSQWLAAPDGTTWLILVRAARLESKTIYQGILLDWLQVQERLGDLVSDLFPTASFKPIFPGDTPNPERAMSILPVQLDPGPLPELPPAGWTPLRIGLLLAWLAAILALLAVGFVGRALLDLSERRIRFVSAVTHELRTPLTSLRLYLDLLTSGMVEDPTKQKEYLTTLANESERLNRLIENVLDFARLEKRGVQAHCHLVGVEELIEQVRQTWADRCAAEGRELVIVSTVSHSQQVLTDTRMTLQILGNLIDNSRKYSRDCAEPRIWLWIKPGDRGKVAFEVEDRGPGVPAGERGTIFRPFRRGHEADTVAGGAGLGLALAKQWADMLGGTLSYRTPEGGIGACFRLELPGQPLTTPRAS